MKILKASLLTMLFSFTVACGQSKPTVPTTDAAADAMARAKAAEADVYSPRLYQSAKQLFDQMNADIDNNNYEVASSKVPQVVELADNATRDARRSKALMKITQLRRALSSGSQLKNQYPDRFNQAKKFLDDAVVAFNEGEADPTLPINLTQYNNVNDIYRNLQGYDRAIALAEKGLELVEIQAVGYTNYRVIKGDTLWDISQTHYNTPWLWPQIWRAYKPKIKDPDLIYPNQELSIPISSNSSPMPVSR